MARPSRTSGKKSEPKARNASAAKGRKTTKTKPRIAPATTRVKRRRVSDPSKDLTEARQQQAATAEILKVIASSPSDMQPVFDAIVASANRLIGGHTTAVIRFIDGYGHLAAFTPINPDADEKLKAAFPQRIADVPMLRPAQAGEVLQIVDTEKSHERLRDIARARGFRSVLYAPLQSKQTSIGVIATNRRAPGPFSAHDVRLLQTFADQAVIAIGNVRLFNETQESLARQTAMAQILEVINSSPGDLKPVFDAILEKATRLCGAGFGVLSVYKGDDMHQVVAHVGAPPGFADMFKDHPIELGPGTGVGRLVRGESFVHIPDAADDDAYRSGHPVRRALVDIAGARTYLAVPIRRDDAMLGSFTIYRREVRPFAPDMIGLLQSFAAQAAIAIDNARLFNETQEALERQTATADILKVIASSPSDVQPVFDAIAHSANTLIGGFTAGVYRFIDGAVHLAAFTPLDPVADTALQASFPRRLSDDTHFRIAQAGEIFQIADTEDQPDTRLKELARARGFRSILLVPLMNKGISIGAIPVSRKDRGPFSDHHIQLLQTFADQAVIAIENTRLFNETQEALERQTATADILKVIASSPSDTTPVFEAIATAGHRLLGGFSTTVFSIVDDMLHLSAFTSTNPSADAALRAAFPRPVSAESWNHRVLNGETVEIPDVETDPVVPETLREMWRKRGFRSILLVPLVRSGKTIGMINTTRVQPGLFSSHHVQLLQAFADQAVIAIENTRLFNETQEALERQTATAEILKVIAGSTSDVQPVFEAIVGSAARLFEPCSATITTLKDDKLHWNATAASASIAGFIDQTRTMYPIPFDRERSPSTRAILERRIIEYPDVSSPDTPEFTRKAAEAGDFRSVTFAPLVDQEQGIGTIIFTHPQAGFRFSDGQLALIQTFADQAVIAIQNTRQFNETQQALERQTATADILKVIASSPSDVQPVFEAIATSANRLIGGFSTAVMRYDGDAVHLAAFTRTDKAGDEPLMAFFPRPLDNDADYQALRNGRVVQIPDTETHPQTWRRDMARKRGFRSQLLVPLTNDGAPIGHISVTRVQTGSFADHHIKLLQTFADQAVIAIGNVRMFDQVQAKTRDLTEALTYQTGSANILSVIASSPTDVRPVLRAIVESACELCDASDAIAFLKDGEDLRFSAHHGSIPINIEKYPINRNWVCGRSVVDRAPLHVHDLPSEGDEFPEGRELARHQGIRTVLVVPLLREGESIGVIGLRRTEVDPFSDKQIALLQTFADQAVIAIGNVRLFEEVQARTRDLTESLQQQTATSEVLEVISASAGELEPVFQKMLVNATRVCGAKFGSMVLAENGSMRPAGHYNVPAEFAAARGDRAFTPHPKSALAKAISTKQVVHVADMRTTEAYLERSPASVEYVELGGARTVAIVPMLRDDEMIGAITVYRNEVQLFSDKQIELLSNFAKQAVIAIENARLLKELRQRTDDLTEALVYQTGSSNILKVIASSPTDVEPALKAIVDSASEICDAYDAVVLLKEGDELRFSAHHGTIPMQREIWPINRQWCSGRAVTDKLTQHVHDVFGPEGDDFPEGRELARQDGHRSVLSVPLLQEGEAIGAITLRRTEVRPFSDKQIELLKSFADQAVIAISNVRLFEQVQQRTRELSKSLDDLRTAQDRLIQTEKLASLGQLTAGIAHEIKNPLNFVNNFSALSVEITDELNDVLRQAELVETIRKETDELTGMLKDNLSKIVQHGKRADSIVKNMLLHSREGSREQRPADVNALVEESLNLAYHGARAEKSGFEITLQRDFDANAGIIEVFPQEVSRALLNLISNGFYAATKRKTENGGAGFEPIVLAITKDLGRSVEIRIRDNGTGIPLEVREKMFNPFFTTKPTGEGTGLGLSMTHDIIVKQHGGRIDVETRLGEFTELIITLPRNNRTGVG
jgi:GAF domain-containing protein